jgi:hypothetical protein
MGRSHSRLNHRFAPIRTRGAIPEAAGMAPAQVSGSTTFSPLVSRSRSSFTNVGETRSRPTPGVATGGFGSSAIHEPRGWNVFPRNARRRHGDWPCVCARLIHRDNGSSTLGREQARGDQASCAAARGFGQSIGAFDLAPVIHGAEYRKRRQAGQATRDRMLALRRGGRINSPSARSQPTRPVNHPHDRAVQLNASTAIDGPRESALLVILQRVLCKAGNTMASVWWYTLLPNQPGRKSAVPNRLLTTARAI